MTRETQDLVIGALDAALAAQISKLFGVLLGCPDGDEEGLARFWRGLNQAAGLHERLVEEIGPEEQCTVPDSSGSSS